MADFIKYINELFGITSATSAPIFITILVFATGQVFIWIRTLFNGLIKRGKTRRLFKEIIKSAIITTQKQEKVFHESLDQMNFEQISNLVHKKIEFYQPRLLEEVGFNNSHYGFFDGIENFHKIRKNRLRSRAYIKCWEIMRTVDFWMQEGYNKMGEFGEKYNRYNDRRNDALKKLGKFNDKLIQNHLGKEIDLNTQEGLYIFKVSEILKKFHERPDIKPHIIHKSIVVPLRILNRKFPKVSYITDMNEHLLEASISYENMYNVLKKQKIQYSLYVCNFRYNYRTFQKALKILTAKC